MTSTLLLIVSFILFPVCSIGEGYRIFEFFSIDNSSIFSGLLAVATVAGIVFFSAIGNRTGWIYTGFLVVLALYVSIKPIYRFYQDETKIVIKKPPVKPIEPKLQKSKFWHVQNKFIEIYNEKKIYYDKAMILYLKDKADYEAYLLNPDRKNPDLFLMLHKILSAIFLSVVFPVGSYFSSRKIIEELKDNSGDVDINKMVAFEYQQGVKVSDLENKYSLSRGKIYDILKMEGVKTNRKTTRKSNVHKFRVVNGRDTE